MEKLTDAEVVKALERCLEDGYDHCSDCPYNEKVQCTFELMSDSLDLIKRKDEVIDGQDVEIMRLKHEIEKLKTELVSADEVIGFRDAEIERLRNSNGEMFVTISKQDEEIERLKKAYLVYEETTGLKQAKSKAYKEFAERLKENIPHFSDGYTTLECTMGAIRYIEKELTEGTKNENE